MDNLGKVSEDQIELKKKFDYVTIVDKQSEKKIIETIHKYYPHHKIYAEESVKEGGGEFRWIIDPLDGTTNYIHGHPVFAVSIAVEYRHEIIVGVVYDPCRDELFVAEKGKGAFLNDRPIHVSALTDPTVGLLGTGFPFRVKHHLDLYLHSFRDLFLQYSGIRRMGCVAIDFCYIACGRYDGFWEINLSPWDVAAGALVIKEAGGLITDFAGGDNAIWSGNVVASNGKIHNTILDAVRHAFTGHIDE
jgi:myo-inositol-1(or 4)-monophosphatase